MSLEPELVAIAFVVESSLQIAQEWQHNSVYQYCLNLLRRLNETNATSLLKIAFVTYATADTVPSPILEKRFFVNFKDVLPRMAKEISSFGIGSTNSGGSTGMAALEGIVAALELFDILHQLHQPQYHQQPPGATPAARNINAHLIHIASAMPDASIHPQFNDSDYLDNVSWDTLPHELKKRNINYSTFNLKPKLPRYPELYAAAVTGGASPWFTVRPTHTLLLAPFAASSNGNGKGSVAKRAGESATADASKRPRLQPATPTAAAASTPTPVPAPIPPPPKPPSKPPASTIVAPSVSVPTQPQPPVPQQSVGAAPAGTAMPSGPAQNAVPAAMPPTGAPGPGTAPAPPPGAGLGGLNPMQAIAAVLGARGPEIMMRFRANVEQIKLLDVEIKNATEKGDTKRVEALVAEQNTKKGLHIQFSNLLAQAKAQAIRRAQQGQGQGQQAPLPGQGQEQQGQQPHSSPPAQTPQQMAPHVQELGSPFTMNASSSSGGPSTLAPPTGAPASSPVAVPPMGHARSTSTTGSIDGLSGLGISPMPPGVSPAMASLGVQAQYQKMFEQRNRMASGGHLAPPLPLRGGIPGGVAPPGGPPGAAPFGIAGPSGMGQPQSTDGVQQGQQPPQPGAAPKPAQSVQVWQGALKWSGMGTTGKKELQCFVIMLSSGPEACHADSWPPVLQLTPTPDGTPMAELPGWMKRHQPALCTVHLQTAGVADTKTNEENYLQLLHMLATRRQCATAAWTTPTGKTSNNVLFFPVNTRTLVAAFFPLTGLPELPKPLSGPMQLLDGNNMAQLPMAMQQQQIANLNSLEPNARMLILQQMMKRQQQLQQQQAQQAQQQQQQPQQQMVPHGQELGAPFGLNPHAAPPNGMPGGLGMGMGMGNPMTANMNAALGMMGQQSAPGGGGAAGLMMGGPAGQIPLRMGAPGVGNMPFDIMQSFMKRSGDGNSGMGG